MMKKIEGRAERGRERCQKQKQRKIRVNVVGPDILSLWDPQDLAFFNLNTTEDLARAEEQFEQGR